MPVIRILVVDRDPFARRALVRALETHDDLKVVGAPSDVWTAPAVAEELAPDVVVLDVADPPRDLDTVGVLHRANPKRAILVLSREDDPALALRALRLGACGFLTKRVGADVLPRIVRAVARGEAVLSRAVTTVLVQQMREIPEDNRGLRPVRSALSSREWEVLDLLRSRASTTEIAVELEMSPETVRSHVKHILRKLGAHSRDEAVAAATSLLRSEVGGYRGVDTAERRQLSR